MVSSRHDHVAPIRSRNIARAFFALTAGLVAYGLILQLVLAVDNDEGLFTTSAARLVNTLSYFTVQSNVLVAVTTGLLAARLDWSSTVVRVLRLSALVGITITGIVFHIALADLHDLTGKAATADWILHTASPLLCVSGWLLFGPRGWVSARTAGLSVLFPALWLTYTLVRGALVDDRFGRDYYPYPFLDVGAHGYPKVALAIVIIAVLFAAIAGAALVLDKRLGRTRP